jgi:PhzF family phenazine biosynthesis protein
MTEPNSIPIWIVDAFADRPFGGNPASVCVLPSYPDERWLQDVAAEMNLSETSFIVPTQEAGRFHLRWLTPTTEVDLCGHATLAAAHALIQCGLAGGLPITFLTRSGELVCTQNGSLMTLDFPATPDRSGVDAETTTALLDAIGIEKGAVFRTKFDFVVEVQEASIVESLKPNFNALQRIETRGVIVTAQSQTEGIDFVSRFFAPRCGINEDPVTGSAHCYLAPFWAERMGKTCLVGYQASPRGGKVICEVVGDRVRLSGNAVTVLEGRWIVPPDSFRS